MNWLTEGISLNRTTLAGAAMILYGVAGYLLKTLDMNGSAAWIMAGITAVTGRAAVSKIGELPAAKPFDSRPFAGQQTTDWTKLVLAVLAGIGGGAFVAKSAAPTTPPVVEVRPAEQEKPPTESSSAPTVDPPKQSIFFHDTKK